MPLKVLVVPLKSIGAMELEMNGFLRRTAGLQPSACPKAEARPFQSPSAEAAEPLRITNPQSGARVCNPQQPRKE